MNKLARVFIVTGLCTLVALVIMFAFYEVAPKGTENTWLVLAKWLMVWIVIVGYRHAMNAMDE